MKDLVKAKDVVEILPNSFFPGVVGHKGVVLCTFASHSAVVQLNEEVKYIDLRVPQQAYCSRVWVIRQADLKVIDSPLDSRIGDLEILLEDQIEKLSFARAMLEYSETLREKQMEVIDDLQQELLYLKHKLGIKE